MEQCIDACNSMLRGERSAVETYDLALEKFGGDPQLDQLRRIRDDHARSVSDLSQCVLRMGGLPDESSGAWGTFANLVQKAANLFGEESAVESLLQGEKKGEHDYQNYLSGDKLSPDAERMFRAVLLPRVVNHIATLERIEEMID
ncbi:MAG: DUF2383 domain-containing protein [Verrucomicrobiales bacterium]|nr:DUF2383 domain-containing protein [Verrucomicrobiales bacterium]